MEKKKEFSRTMRIDLIPDAPSEPVAEEKSRVVIATPASKKRRALESDAAPADSRYQELLQSVYDAALISDLKGKIVDANVRAAEFFLCDREELCEMTVFDMISGADETLIQTLLDNLQDERYTLIQAYCIRQDGSMFPAEIAVNKLRLGEMHLSFFVRDTTVRRQKEDMLRTEHNAIQNSGNAIAVADIEAKLEYVNPALAAMWGYGEPEELLGLDARDLLKDRDAAEKMVEVVMRNHETWMEEMQARKKEDGEFDVQVSAACNRNSDGEPVGIVFSFVDISDRKRADQAARETERQRVMLESLGAACHHLGQPATVLMANLGILQKKTGDSDAESVELIDGSIEAAKSLGKILHKLNEVTEYKTMPYLRGPEGSGIEENRILEI